MCLRRPDARRAAKAIARAGGRQRSSREIDRRHPCFHGKPAGPGGLRHRHLINAVSGPASYGELDYARGGLRCSLVMRHRPCEGGSARVGPSGTHSRAELP